MEGEEIKERIQRISLKNNFKDNWVLSKNVYSVKKAYSLIIEGLANSSGAAKELMVA